jgi:protocatechuate 3,4-dioxygenase beta subunit
MQKCYGFFIVALLTITAGSLFAQAPHPPDFVDGRLKFISAPPLTVSVGEKYVYKAVAASSDSAAVIRYYANVPVKGFAIDSVTGVVNWTPDSKGWFPISVIAKSNKGGMATQSFIVEVSGGNGIVQGTVTDTLGNPIARVIVEAMKTQTSTMGPSTGLYIGTFSYSATTDQNGKYRISRIDPGTYKIHANSPSRNYLSQWYDGKEDPTLANIVTVRDTPNVTIADFKLRGGITSVKKVTVKGTVTDTLGHVLKSVTPQVFFASAGFALNSNSSVDDFRKLFDAEPSRDFRLDGNSDCVFQAKPDSLGAYSLQLPMGSYIAYASAPGYATDYYFHQPDIRSANTLNLQKDSSRINFKLALLPPVVFGKISGTVLDSAKGVGVRSRVIAIRDYWTAPDPYTIARSYTFDTDTLGAYTASSLVPGTYIILAIPVGTYAPAYYTTDTSNTRWKKATKLVINGNSISSVDIYVRPLNATARGYAGVTGSIRTGSQVPIAGAIVYANLNNTIAGYAIADNNGTYQISGISPNAYTLTVDMAGYSEASSQTSNVSYLANGSPVVGNVSFFINSVVTSVSRTESTIPTEIVLSQNYPNPFNPSTIISYAIPSAGRVTLKVFTMLGQEVATLVDGYQQAGIYQLTFSGLGLSSGVYFYQLRMGNNTLLTRKMLLMK